MSNNYQYNKTWRKKYPLTWKEQKMRYYDQFNKCADNKGQQWTIQDTELVMKKVVSDRILAHIIKRSVRAIQIQRTKQIQKIKCLNKGNNNVGI